MNFELVKINTATPDEISQLYQVGPRVAERIVAHRNENGYFRGPDDLAQVKGVGLQLATTLSPHIDWSVPKSPLSRRWAGALVATFIGFSLGRELIRKAVPQVAASWSATHTGQISGWVQMWLEVSLTLGLLACLLASLAGIVYCLTIRHNWRSNLVRAVIVLFIVFAVSRISYVVNRIVYIYCCGSWGEVLRREPFIGRLLLAAFSCLFIVLVGIVRWFPQVINMQRIRRLNRMLQLSTAAGFWIGAALSICALVSLPTLGILGIWERTLWEAILQSLLGLLFLTVSLWWIRGDETFFYGLFLFVLENALRVTSRNGALRWLNTYLPDPDAQRELQQALNQRYPRRPSITIIVILLGFGVFILQAAAGGIIELYAQRLWQRLTCYCCQLDCPPLKN